MPISPIPLDMVKAVVFDMDGVLVDSEPVHYQSTVMLMEDEFGISFSEEENSEFLGSTDRHMWEVLKDRHGLPQSVDMLIDLRKAVYVELLKDGIPWRDGIRDLIAHLHDAGYQLAVASSALRHIITMVIADGDLERFFPVVVSGEDVVRPKPHPDIYTEAARRLGLDPSDCIAIEDTTLGVRAAVGSGMRAIAFPCTTTENGDFSLASVRVDSVARIRKLFNL